MNPKRSTRIGGMVFTRVTLVFSPVSTSERLRSYKSARELDRILLSAIGLRGGFPASRSHDLHRVLHSPGVEGNFSSPFEMHYKERYIMAFMMIRMTVLSNFTDVG